MSPGRVQEILTAAGLPTTHDAVSAVASLGALFSDRTRMSALLDEAPADSLDVLSRLVWGPPYGQVTADPATRLRWLLDRGLLLPTAPGTVVLPREVALHLRAGRAHRSTEPLPPQVEIAATHRPPLVDATAAGQAYTALATVEELLKDWHEGGPAVLRAGGLSVRDLKRTAVALDVPEPTAAFWVELTYAAGLLASDGEAEERYAATPAYDEWLELPAAERWSRLATAWLAATRTAGLVGGRDAKERTLSALGPGLDRSAASEVRRRVLALLADLPEGASAAPASVLARLRWERPLRGTHPSPSPSSAPSSSDDLRTRLAEWTLSEAEQLGFTGRGALSSHGRALLGAPPAPAKPPAPPARATSSPSTTGTTTCPPSPKPPRSPPPNRRRPPPRPPVSSPRSCPPPGPRPAPGGPDRGGARPAGASAGRHARRARGRGVEGRGDGLPLHARLRAARPGRGPCGVGPARVPRGPLADAGPAAPRLSDRRRGPQARPPPHRRGLGLCALRRRHPAERDPRRQALRRTPAAPAGPHGAGGPGRPGDAARRPARDGLRAGRRVRRGRCPDHPRPRPPHPAARGPEPVPDGPRCPTRRS